MEPDPLGQLRGIYALIFDLNVVSPGGLEDLPQSLVGEPPVRATVEVLDCDSQATT
jgi:hypothetical protein